MKIEANTLLDVIKSLPSPMTYELDYFPVAVHEKPTYNKEDFGQPCDKTAVIIKFSKSENGREWELELRDETDIIRKFIADDALAISFQTMGQYRSAILKMLNT